MRMDCSRIIDLWPSALSHYFSSLLYLGSVHWIIGRATSRAAFAIQNVCPSLRLSHSSVAPTQFKIPKYALNDVLGSWGQMIMSWTRCQIGCKYILFAHMKSYTGFRLVPKRYRLERIKPLFCITSPYSVALGSITSVIVWKMISVFNLFFWFFLYNCVGFIFICLFNPAVKLPYSQQILKKFYLDNWNWDPKRNYIVQPSQQQLSSHLYPLLWCLAYRVTRK